MPAQFFIARFEDDECDSEMSYICVHVDTSPQTAELGRIILRCFR